MADRRLAGAAAALVAALVVAGAAVLVVALRPPPVPPPAMVAVPPPPPSVDSPAAEPPAEPREVGKEAAARRGPEVVDDASGERAREAPAAAEAAPPQRVVVVATGLAWNDELAAAAAFHLPEPVAFALPADFPAAEERLAGWRAAGRAVAVRFDWRATADVATAGAAVPLAGRPAVQAARMTAQWSELEEAAAAVVVEPRAAEALAPIARSLATSRGAPVLLAAETPAAPPRAWRLDPGLLGEAGLEAALDRVVESMRIGDTLVLLIEIYPALLDRLADWLRGLEAHGIALAPLDSLSADRS